MQRNVYLLYLDPHHLGDRLFVDDLAKQLAAEGAPRCMIVHGSGEKLERTFESQGLFPEREDGVLQVEGVEQQRLAERAVREANGELVAALTDAAVAAVGVQGADRGLLHRTEEGALTAGRTGWIGDLLRQRIVPVVSALVGSDGRRAAHEVSLSATIRAITTSLADFTSTVVFFTGADGEVPDAAGRIADAGLPVHSVTVSELVNLG